jgi:hypothetical protein
MRKQRLALIILAIILTPLSALSQAFPYTHARLLSINDSWQAPCGQAGAPTQQIATSLQSVPAGGTLDLTCYQTPIALTQDVFSPVSIPITLILPPFPITVSTNVTVPSNFTLVYQNGSALAVSTGYLLTDNSTPIRSSQPFQFLVHQPGTAPTLTPTTGGVLAPTDYFYVVTATGGSGETQASPEATITLLAGDNAVGMTWPAVSGTAGYKIYRGTASGHENVYYTSATNSFTDLGGASTAGSPPAVNTAWITVGTGVGIGTVTSFSAGALSPLFTTSVATPSTTPALSFTLSHAAAFTLFGNDTNASAAPSYFTMDSLFGSCSGATDALTFSTTTHTFGCNTMSAGGVVSLDSLTGALTLGIGTTGTAPNWSPSGTTDTLNLPAASGTGVTAGTISHADWLTATSQNALSINSGAMPVSADLIGTNPSGQPVYRTYTNVVALFGGGSCAGVLNYDGTCVTAGNVSNYSSPEVGQTAIFSPDATHITGVWPGVPPIEVTGTTLTFLGSGVSGDQGKQYLLESAVAGAATLPQAGTTGFTSDYYVALDNDAAGTWTITTTGSTISKNHGTPAATATVVQYEHCGLTSDNANYFLTCSESSSAPAGTVAWSSIGAATANTTINVEGYSTTFTASSTAQMLPWLFSNNTPATAGSVKSMPTPIDWTGQIWDGTTSQSDVCGIAPGALGGSPSWMMILAIGCTGPRDFVIFSSPALFSSGIKDGTLSLGNPGQILSSTGSGLSWIDNTGYITSLPPTLFTVTGGVATLVTQPAGTFFGSPGNGAAAVVQASPASGYVSGSSFPVPLTTYQVTAGHSLLVIISGVDDSSSHASVADDHSDSFSYIYGGGGSWYWLATGVAGGSTTITVTLDSWSQTTTGGAIALELTPIATSSPVDVEASSSSASVSLTTLNANDLIISAEGPSCSFACGSLTFTVASPFNLQNYGNWNGFGSAIATVSAPIVGTYTASYTFTGSNWGGAQTSIIALRPGASNGVPSFMQLPTHDLQNLTDVNGVQPAAAPSTQVPVLTGAISYQGSAAQGTSGSPLTLTTLGAANAQVTIHASGNCTASGSTAFAFFVSWTDTSSTVQTVSPATQPSCSTLGPASMAAIDLSVNAKASTAVTYYTTITSTPAYDLRITAQQNTTQ